ncbi:MAG: cache domain-containing protein [Verrucomicrobiota bacterium]
MKIIIKGLAALACVIFTAQVVCAQDAEALAKESEAAIAATATTKPTAQAIIDKVNEGCALLEKEGAAAFPKFQGKDSKFFFCGTYIWIHDMKAMMRMHPIKYKMNNTSLAGFKDANGKLFFLDMNEVCAKKGAGWVDYMWPKPGEKGASRKISYVKLAKHGADEFVVGCGVYDLTDAEMQSLLGK